MLATLKARLKALTGELDVLVAKDAPTSEDITAIGVKTDEIEKLEAEIATLERAEAARARAAVPATTPISDPMVPAEVKTKLDPAEKISILMAGMVTALHEEGTRGFRPTMKAISERGYDALTKELAPMQGKALNSSQATAGGILLPENMSNDVIDLLRPNATFLQGGPTVIPMPNGTFKQPKAASGATAAYRGETGRKSVSQPSFKDISMSAKLLAGIVPISNQLIRWSGPNIGEWARSDLSSAMGLKLDYMSYFGDGAEDTPIGIFNKPGVTTHAALGGTAPTVAQADATARLALTPLRSYAQLVQKVEWRMAPRTFDYLSDMRDGNGNLIYPSLQAANPTWKGGFPVRVTTQFPTNLGVGTNESYIALIAFGHVLFGDALRMQLAISDTATVVNGSETIHAFQQGVTLIAAEAEHDFDVRYVEAVQVIGGVTWGA